MTHPNAKRAVVIPEYDEIDIDIIKNNMRTVGMSRDRKEQETMTAPLSQRDILNVLKAEKPHLRNKYGVLNIGLFGSYAKGTQHADSDIDFLVELEAPRFDWIAGLQIYLEEKFGRRIELVRKGNKLNRRFMERIGGEVIYA